MKEKLKEKIRALIDSATSTKADIAFEVKYCAEVFEEKKQRLQKLRQQIDRMIKYWKPAAPKKIKPCRDLLDVTSGEYFMREGQKIFISRVEYPAEFRHGDEMIGRFLKINPITFKKIAKLKNVPSLDGTLFLDIETTGLTGGAGTLAFLIGYGFFKGNRFVVESIFLPDPKSERLALGVFRERTKEFSHLITYNGKGFDLNVLKARYILNREEFLLDNLLHSDLLFIARRFWKYGLLNCKLATIESEILKGYRQSDVSADKIADLYFYYLRCGPHKELKLIFEHNRYDILSLVSLAIKASDMLTFVKSAGLLPSEMWGLARFYLENREVERAIEILEELVGLETGTELAGRAAWELSLCYKSCRMWERAEELWLELRDNTELFPKPHIELLKYYEHTKRDIKRAMTIAVEAKEMVNIVKDAFRHSIVLDDISRRIERLGRKSAGFFKLKEGL